MYTSKVIWRIFFGEESFAEGQNAHEVVELILRNMIVSIDQTISIWYLLFGPKFFKLGLRGVDRQYIKEDKLVKKLLYSKLQKLRDNQKNKSQQETAPSSFRNLIELLLEQAEGLPDLEIASQIFTFFIAGTDTTSELLAASQYFLATLPNVQSKLREEVLSHLGNADVIKYEDLVKMEYLNAFIKEALRVAGPAGGVFARVATQDFTLGDIKVRKGTFVNTAFAAVANNPRYFKNPEQFRPERWIEKEDAGTLDSSAYLPFSAGPRRCIGEQLALIESRIILCNLVRQFNISIKSPNKLKMGLGLVYHADPPINAIYTLIN